MRTALLALIAIALAATPASADQWIDAATGQAVQYGPVFTNITTEATMTGVQNISRTLGVRPDAGDPNRAYDPQTGRNCVRVKTGCPPKEPQTAKQPKLTEPVPPVKLDKTSSRILYIHNTERAAVGAPPLRWNPALESSATAWAQELARIGQLVHAPREGRGIERENLSQGNLWWTTDQMMANWIGEKRYFRAGVYPNVCGSGDWSRCAHYSQMIWPTTTDLGCGMASGSGSNWLVCRYSPGGNKPGKLVGQPAPIAAVTSFQWIDVKTGKPVASFPVITDPNGPAGHKTDWVRPDVSDPNRAYDPRTGRNFAKENGEWIDVKTGQKVASFPVVTDPNGPAGDKTDWVRPDVSNPNRAYDPRTGRNFARVPVPAAVKGKN